MTRQKLNLLDLPTEILLHILAPLPTPLLLPLTPLCRPVHDLIVRILRSRLLLAATDPSHRLILEAYHPSLRYAGPYLFCTYLGTEGLSSTREGVGGVCDDDDNGGGGGDYARLGKLGALYSAFRPEYPGEEGRIPIRRIAGAAPVFAGGGGGGGGGGDGGGMNTVSGVSANASPIGSESVGTASSTNGNTNAHPTTPVYRNAGDGGAKKIVYAMHLDEGELFGQFCVSSQLVSGFRRRGIFDSTVNVIQPGCGTIRIWREWLLRMCRESYQRDRALEKGKGGAYSGGDDNDAEDLTRTSTMQRSNIRGDPAILWTDQKKNIGLRVEVRHHDVANNSRAQEELDELPLSCDLIIQELVVRTTHLMFAVEDAAALLRASNGPRKALIFGNFASRIFVGPI